MTSESNTLRQPITYRGVVYPWQCDQMGHMNVMWYIGKFDEATWQLFGQLGLGPSRLKANGRAMAGVQQNTTYKRELHPGDLITVRSRILEVRERTIRFLHEMTNDQTGEIVATTELTAVTLDHDTRKSVAFPPDVIKSARDLIMKGESPTDEG
jgi:acyl-CoA thioester hydrolase